MTNPSHASGEGSAPSSAPISETREVEGNATGHCVFRQSYNQHALWFLHRLDPLSSAYNLSFAVNLENPPETAVLKAHLSRLQERHSTLRTTFFEEGGEPLQKVHDDLALPLEVKDVREWTEEAVTLYLADAGERPFDLATGPLWRLVLLRGEKRAALMICAHHIISDFQSLVILFEELCALCNGREPELPEVDYRDYVLRQQKLMDSPRGEKLKAWWREHLADAEGVLRLPTDKPRPPVQMHHGDSLDFYLPDQLARELSDLAVRQGVSLHTLLLSGFQALLHRLSDADGVSVGSPASGRDKPFRRCVGYFLNPLVQHADFRGNPGFAQLLEQMHGVGLKILRRRHLPFELLVRELHPQRDPGRSPLFQAMFTLLDAPGRDSAGAIAMGRESGVVQIEGLRFSARPMPHRLSQFDISLFMTRTETGLAGSFDYNTDLFEHHTIERRAQLLVDTLAAMASDINRPVSEIPLLTAEETERLQRVNATARNIPDDFTIHGAFAARSRQEPERTALIFQDHRLTYRNVQNRASAMAAALQALGVQAGDRIAVCLERSPDLVVAVLGIMSAGAAWVPLDPYHPPARLSETARDAGVRVVISGEDLHTTFDDVPVICMEQLDETAEHRPVNVDPAYTAYILYTSGSTGTPKGVAVSHANAGNFFYSMDRVVGGPKPGADVWCAVTNLTFDIAVLELLWAPSRGYTVLLQATHDGALHGPTGQLRFTDRPMDFGLFYFADSEVDADNKYRLLTEGAQFADCNGFTSVWTPERHFHSFGGLYPNPAVSGAAVGVLTERVHIRAGSVVLPINDPIRTAEEWSLVDNLTNGRAGISIASGWNADDFVLSPRNFRDNKDVMLRNLETIRALWRGESISRRNGAGEMIDLKIHPRPVQAELPIWMTAAGNPDTFRIAGELGANVLTHLLGQTLEDLAEKIDIYRKAFAESGRPGKPYVTLMLHTFVDDDAERVRALVQEPFRNYLRGSFGLMKGLAKELGLDVSSPHFTEEHREMLVDHAFNRFFSTSALFGTPETCLHLIDRLKGIGVDEVGCLIDFGVPLEDTLRGLESLNRLRQLSEPREHQPEDYSFARHVEKYEASHLQCTPSLMRLLLADKRARHRLARLQTILLGGEAVPDALLKELQTVSDATILNMYGPTETTIWSTAEVLGEGPVLIGKPVDNTVVYVLDRYGRPRPFGAQGELWIGGAGVAQGYLQRPRLTAERFRPDPFGDGERLYRTGDAVRLLPDGRLDFLGRVDHQVKLRGHRIELGEIEAVLSAAPNVQSVAVLVQGQRLTAYVVTETPDEAGLRAYGHARLPEYMVPAGIVFLDRMPLSPSGKVDRKALPAMGGRATRTGPVAKPQNEVEARIVAVWQELLGREDIGIHDSFFELGGHSLLLARAHTRLQDMFGRDLDMVELFRYPTVHALAQFFNSRPETGAQEVERKRIQRKQRRRRSPADRAVAVIGMACRFPGADSIEAFWQNLVDGTNSVSFFTHEELLKAGVSPEQLQDPDYVPAGAVIADAESFDAAFFGYSPAEAALLDPQHRVFLETAWSALENAALDPARAGTCGVFAGVGMNTYLLNNLMPNRARLKHLDDFQIMIANDKDFLTTRLAYKLNLHGPGLTVQTACSTSLTAVNAACEYLAAGKCDVAIAGGVTVRAPQIEGYPFRPGMISSPDGYCRAFDADGAGVLFGSGAGVVVLKSLEAAIADGDPIHAVVKGWAVNNDGSDKISFAAPSVEGQAAVIREAMDHAGVTPDRIAYVEAHGTATELGDPIEMTALGLAYGDLPAGETVGVGSVKTNFGHLDAASGAAGFIKTALALKHRTLPPSLFFKKPNPRIDFEGNPFYVVSETRKLEGTQPLAAGVSSFGIGGTNAHTILEEAPQTDDPAGEEGPLLFPLSAATPTALQRRIDDLHAFIDRNPDMSPAAVARTLQVGRAAMKHRLAIAAHDLKALVSQLEEARDQISEPDQGTPGVGLMFPGGGAQYVRMGRDLYQGEPVFRRWFDQCADLLLELNGPNLRDLLYPDADGEAAAERALEKVDNAMPAVFAVCYAMARLLEARGITVQSMIGQSTGEYVAATLAEVFDLKDALAILLKRGELFARTPRGAALSIHMKADEIRPLLDAGLSLALINGPDDCVAAGEPEAVDALQARLEERGVSVRRIHLDAAVHSHMLNPILPEFRQFLAGLQLHPPRKRFISCVTGAWITTEEATDPDYWVRHLRHTNRFGEGLDMLLKENGKILLEAGPGRTLTTLALRRPGVHAFASMRHPKQDDDDRRALLQAIGGLWTRGVEIDWDALSNGPQPRRITLPGYPFERRRYWIDPPEQRHLLADESKPLLFSDVDEVKAEPVSEQNLTPTEAALADLWRPLLGLRDLGRHADFFELGGDSLLATRLRTHIRESLQLDLSLKELFDHPTLSRQAARLDREGKKVARLPVIPVPRDGDLPLSFSQQRLWFLDRLEGPSATYNMREALRLTGAFDPAAMHRAIEQLVQRHETLRTTFNDRDGRPYQVIAPADKVALPLIDLSACPEPGRTASRLADTAVVEPFDLHRGPLVRFRLLRLSADEHLFLVVKHHIIGDGWSIGVMVRELTELYRGFTENREPVLIDLPVQYADYSVYQRQQLQGEVLESQLDWWRKQLAGAPPLLDLPLDRPRPAEQTFNGAAYRFTVPEALTQALHELARTHEVTDFMVLESLFAVLTGRYSRADDVLIGSPVANREIAEIEGLIGFFVNTLTMRHSLQDDPSFVEFLQQTAEKAHGAYAHQDAPFELVVDACVQERSRAYTPLFQVMFILQNVEMGLQQLPGLQLESTPVDHISSMFDLTLFLEEKDGRLDGMIEYNTDLFDLTTVVRMADHYLRLAESVTADADVSLSLLPMLDLEERQTLLTRWNQTEEPRGADLLPQRFLSVAAVHPQQIAAQLAGTDESLTYEAAARRAQALAAVLQKHGAAPGIFVGVYLDRSLDLLTALLGVQLAGAAYLPLDPGFPVDRLRYMVEHSGAGLVITDSRRLEDLELGEEVQPLLLDRIDLESGQQPTQITPHPQQAAYVIYTSGSTGRPKGVVVSHGALINFLDTMARRPGLQRDDRLLAVTTVSFDIAGLELYLPLCRGARVVIATREQAADGAQLLHLLKSHLITVMQATPATWRLMLLAGWTGSPELTVLCGGEALPRELAKQLLSRGRTLWNLYGPTETTIWSARRCITESSSGDDAESIGGPIGATTLYVLDAHLQPTPYGVAGELYIGGAGLARGYHRQPDLTATLFVPNPFEGDGSRLYRTGDLVRRRPDGDIEFIGRVDHQVKVRGYRIELGEIESLLEQDPAVRQCTAVVREDVAGDPRIIGYVVGDPDALASDREVKDMVADWADVWNDAYSAENSDPTFNINGWNDSYTGRTIEAAHMRAWLNATAERILACKPRRVLEIGCGTGLILFSVAPHVDYYLGSDIAAEGLQAVRAGLSVANLHETDPDAANPDQRGVGLKQVAANHLTEVLGNQRFDTVVLNSTAQYFPDRDYLAEVLKQAASLVTEGGHIFVGDVRDLDLLPAFHRSLLLHRAGGPMDPDTLAALTAEAVARETELVLHPEWFARLCDEHPRLTGLEVLLKPAEQQNELNRFRYDVILHVGSMDRADAGMERAEYGQVDLEKRLVARPEILVLDDVPNRHIDSDGVFPSELNALAASFDYELTAVKPAISENGAYTAVFTAAGFQAPQWRTLFPADSVQNPRLSSAPLLGRLNRDLAPRMRRLVQSSLPAYMIPAAFVMLERMPLTPNGKVDRKALTQDNRFRPERVAGSTSTAYVAPSNETETALVGIWSALLGVERIGVNDSFFELGGHSLLAVQLLHRIGAELGVAPTLGDLFEAPTIAGLAALVSLAAHSDDRLAPDLPRITPDPAVRYTPFPLTDVQHAYLVGRGSAFELGNIATHGYTEFDCTDLDLQRLQDAWNKLIQRHDMLRAVFDEDGTQRIQEHTPAYIVPIRDLTHENPAERDAQLAEIRETMSHMVHDPGQWPLFSVEATRMDTRRTRIHVSFDALITDAWSGFILLREWTRFYREPDWHPEPLSLSFRDYVPAAEAFEQHPSYTKAMAYWQERLPDLPPAPDLPLAVDPGQVQTPRFERRRARLAPEDWARLRARAASAGVSDSALLLTAFSEILGRWTRNPAFTINLTLFNRLPLHDEINHLVGDFTTTTLLAVTGEGPDFSARAKNLQQQLWRDLDHRQVGGVRLLRELAKKSGDPRGAAMPVVFTSTLGAGSPGDSSQIGKMVYAITQTPQVWLDHQVMEEEGALVFNWDFVAELFPEHLIDAMFNAYTRHLSRLAEDETAWQTPELDLLPADQAEIRRRVNSDKQDFPLETTFLHTMFADRAVAMPQRPAVFAGGMVLTYEDIYRRAEHLGRLLRDDGIGPGDLVAVSLDKGWEQVVSVLAILRAGGAYVPIDPQLPRERLLWLAETCEVRHVLTRADIAGPPWPETIRVIHVDQAGMDDGPVTPWTPLQKSTDLAYIIFTSGSTGKPKGVMIDHRGAVNTILDINRRWSVAGDDRVLAVSSLSFDLSVYDIFGLLGSGGALVYPDPDKLRDPGHWLKLIREHRVTIWNSVPALMRMLVEYTEEIPGDLRLCLMSGDWIPVSLPDRIAERAPGIETISLGGATEASIWSIFHPIHKVEAHWESIPYGKPLANQRFHVLNQNLEPCPDYVPGDLYIAGKGLALGYRADAAKTNAAFFNHPRTGERLYRTGDLGRYLPDGSIEFLGREDFQVKVGGYRIELGEIETALEQHPAVAAAVVTAPGDKNNRRLAAYIQPAEQTDEGVLVDPLSRTEFKLSRTDLRPVLDNETRVTLYRPEPDPDAWISRQSFRRFQPQPIPARNFGRFLACLQTLHLDDKPVPKRRYASAGSLYPVQLYLCLADGAVEGMQGGAYYYHPDDHQLIRVGDTAAVPAEAYAPFNRVIAHQARLQLFLIGKVDAVRPIYGDLSHQFCMLEAGYVSQLLMSAAGAEGLGLCPVGGLQQDHCADWFQLQDEHWFLHGFLGGAVSRRQLETWEGEPPETKPMSVTALLTEHLRERIPEYMVPSKIVVLDTLPLTANGKIDRKALPDPDGEGEKPAKAYAAPETWTEQQLVKIAESLLDVTAVGRHDNFFELGANSLIATKFLARIRDQFGCALSLRTLFEHTTMAALADRIDASLTVVESTADAATDMMEGVL
ncbi:MAG: amino acid adenylation domain-containing protein [Acidobacteriota bacterium]|nr:amino acid adenylation domain-containing protein [Acidobacteriota bacterium]